MTVSFSVRRLFGVLFLITMLGSVAVVLSAEHTKDSLNDVKKGVADNKAVLLDVREKGEWDKGHLRDARFVALSALRRGIKADKLAQVLPKDKVIYCHCASGQRCLKAADLLQKEGYDVRPLKAGYQELLKSGFPAAEK